MAARTGLADYITEIRQSAEIGKEDYTLGTVTYWSDNHIQTYLDRYREDLYRVEIKPVSQYEGGSLVYKKYYCPYRYLEEGTDVFEIEDQAGDPVGTALYSVDYAKGIVTFASDTGGSAYFLTGYAHNLNMAIAKIWSLKASHYAGRVDFSTDNHSIKASQYQKHCVEMASYYRQGGDDFGIQSVEVIRGDHK